MKVFEDVKKVVKLGKNVLCLQLLVMHFCKCETYTTTVYSTGKKYIIKRFCEIHELFNNSYEPRYLLNQLYIKDYLIWLQQAPLSVIESIVPMLDAVSALQLLFLIIQAGRAHREHLSIVLINQSFLFIVQVTPTKADMGFDLDELEVATWSVYSENLCFENVVNEISSVMKNSTLEDREKEK